MRKMIAIAAILMMVALLFGGVRTGLGQAQTAYPSWMKDWLVQPGFAVQKDTEGYHFPTAIAFVPHPGNGPKDVLYYVTELRGTVKAVTNDRSIYTFAENFFSLQVQDELPGNGGQVGMAGLCLDPVHGYVFVTYAYQDSQKILRNNIMRFETTPGTFGLKSTGQLSFEKVFLSSESALSHQIGACVVQGDAIYASLGDGGQPRFAQDLSKLNGKIVRLSLDGQALPDNPFYQDSTNAVENYIWAYGLRNPFGLSLAGDKLFEVENGLNIDRFVWVQKGRNYQWDGTDNSIQLNASIVFTPGIAPVFLEYYSGDSGMLPKDYADHFFISLDGAGGKEGKVPGIMTFGYDVQNSFVTSPPEFFLKYHGSDYQNVIGIALGPDGLYFSPLFPADDVSIYKIVPDPTHAYPYLI